MTSSVIRKILFNPIGKIALPESMVVHTIKWFHQVMRHPGDKTVTWDVEPTSLSSQALVSDWCGKKLPSILTPPTGNIIFKVADLLKSCKVKVNGRQVKFNAFICIDKASKLVKLISNNTECAMNTSAWLYQTIHNVLRTLVHANLKTIHNVLRTLVHANLKTIHNVLRTVVHTNPPRNMTQARDIMHWPLQCMPCKPPLLLP